MRERDQEILIKYQMRASQEYARKALVEILEFLDEGVPDSYQKVSANIVKKVQTSFQDILESTCTSTIPREESMRVFNSCLNRKSVVHCYNPLMVYWREDESESGKRKIIAFEFEDQDYLRRVADLLKRCLTEYYHLVFFRVFKDDEWLLRICGYCNKLFVKKRTDQICCSRECSKRHDYLKRTKTEAGKEYYRTKSASSSKKRREAKGMRKIDELYRKFKQSAKFPDNYKIENAILEQLRKDGFRIESKLSPWGLRTKYGEYLKHRSNKK